MFFGGISLCFDPAASTYHELLAANAAQKTTMIDPNVRPEFAPDTDAYFTRLKQMIALSDIIKVSDDDLDMLIDGDQNSLEKLAEIKATGPSIDILTRGAKEVSALFSGGQIAHVSAPQVSVKDTIGAGDTFNAGFLAKLESLDLLSMGEIENISPAYLQGALDYGVEAAAIVVQREGADPPWASELT